MVMGKLEFILNLPTQPEQLMKLSEDYENLSKYLPDQLKSVKILDENENEVKTEETVVFSTIVKKEIIQQTMHKKIKDNTLVAQILSGPAKGTIINSTFEKNDSGSKVTIDMDLKLELKAKILQPLIKKYYKMILTCVLYRMNNEILENVNTQRDI
jgi:ribosome-associated toxin RatA of RatAB toxin-antitoxin module